MQAPSSTHPLSFGALPRETLAAGIALAAFGLPAATQLLNVLDAYELPSEGRAIDKGELRFQETVAAVSAACTSVFG